MADEATTLSLLAIILGRLVLHVGPGKCGSSSIQQFFATQKDPCIQKTGYKLLSPSLISRLDSNDPSTSLADKFVQQVSQDLEECDVLILSHESLFKRLYAIRDICQAAKCLTDSIAIIGYSRRQSDFIVSAYSQWFFRSLERVKEVNSVMVKLGLNPALFTGLERQMIASIEDNFYSARQISGHCILDWSKSYNAIIEHTREASAEVLCGVIPSKESEISLIEDFCAKAGLTLYSRLDDAVRKVANKSYDHDVVEALNIAVSLGLHVMGPHEDNDAIQSLSSLSVTNNEECEFVSKLKSYVDAYFVDSNHRLCKQFGLAEAYFRPAQAFSKKEILEIIFLEEQKRTLCMPTAIEKYRLLSARMVELCIHLAKNRSS